MEKSDLDRFAKRRVPRQDRSRFMVENIKQAALDLIAKEGCAQLGTARIAERAGISIGSLYHYFPTCEAILLALYEDVTTQLAAMTKRMLLDIMEMPTAAGVEYVVRSLLKLHIRHQLVLIRLVEETPEIRFSAHPLSLDQLTRSSIRLYLHHQHPGLDQVKIERMAQFIGHIVLSSIRWYLGEDPPKIGREAFVSDLSRMIAAYIGGHQ